MKRDMARFKQNMDTKFEHQSIKRDIKKVTEEIRSTGINMDGSKDKDRIERAKKNAGKRKLVWDKEKMTFVEPSDDYIQSKMETSSGTGIIMNDPGSGMGRIKYKGKRVS